MTSLHRWATTRLKYIADCNVATLPETTDPDYEFFYVDIGNVIQGSMTIGSSKTKFSSAPSRARRLAEPGDSVVSTVRTYLRAVATVPAIGDPLVFSTGFAVLHPMSHVLPEFLSWYLQGDQFVSRIEATSVGVSYPAITSSNLMSLPLKLPPIDEQHAVADFLDRETARIDALIARQEQLIGMLQERRSRILTSSFESSPTRKRIRVRRLLASRPSYGVLVPRYDEGPSSVPYVRVGDLGMLNDVSRLSRIEANQSNEYSRTVLWGGEVLLGVVGNMGQAVVAPDSLRGANVARAVAVLRCTDAGDEHLLVRWFGSSSFRLQAALATSGDSVQPTLGMGDLAGFELYWPSGRKQRDAQLSELTEQLLDVAMLIAKAEEFIALSKERRSALITAAVTGQIDVRDKVA